MITIQLNGKPHTTHQGQTLTGLLHELSIDPHTVTVARNGTFLPRERYETTRLESGDVIDVLEPIWGG